MAFIECRDTSISLWQDGESVTSPGFVLLEGKEYRFGQEALEQSRLRPRDSSSRFWWQLSTQALKPALGSARHSADLVHAHLQSLHRAAGEPEALCLVVPESMPREQLSLLLGIAQACDFKVTGLASRSVLLASALPDHTGGSSVVHVEAQLNQAVVNQTLIEDGLLSIERSTPLPSCGLLAIYERYLSVIASAFVQQTRFDPRRSAASEQSLFNQLPDLLRQLKERGEVSIDIDGHRCRVTSAAVEAVLDKLAAGINDAIGAPGATLLLDGEFGSLPGIEAALGNVQFLSQADSWRAWEHQHAAIELDDPELHLVDHLPVSIVSSEGDAASQDQTSAAVAPAAGTASPAVATSVSEQSGAVNGHATQATHVLLGTRALPLRGEKIDLSGGYALQKSEDSWTLHGDGALINGLPSSPKQPLVLGDTLSLGAAGHGRLIEVVS